MPCLKRLEVIEQFLLKFVSGDRNGFTAGWVGVKGGGKGAQVNFEPSAERLEPLKLGD